MNNHNKKSNKYKQIRKIFISCSCITTVVLLSMFAMFMTVNQNFTNSGESNNQSNDSASTDDNSNSTSTPTDQNSGDSKHINMNIALLAVDEDGTRTDTILVANIDSLTSTVSMVSIPRDTKVYWTDEQKENASSLGKTQKQFSKINEMSHHTGLENIEDFTLSTIEDLLDITIDHYVIIDPDIVVNIVDALGGVTFDVPRRMEYVDNYQGLYIDLYPGVQTLNGEQAEGLLRWRKNNDGSEQYALGDEGRIETQQKFIMAVIDTILSPQGLLSIVPLINTFYEDVDTNVSLFDALAYVKYIDDFLNPTINSYTLPGEAVKENGTWYFMPEYPDIEEFASSIF